MDNDEQCSLNTFGEKEKSSNNQMKSNIIKQQMVKIKNQSHSTDSKSRILGPSIDNRD